jgi:hypothetical protein
MPERYDDEKLARIMRRGLRERAAHAADRLSHPVPSGHRPRALWLLGVAAAAVAVAGVPLTLQAVDNQGTSTDPVVTDPAMPPGAPDDWRVESYGGIQVRLPPTWGWGGAPFEESWTEGRVTGCGSTTAFVVPGSDNYEFVDKDTPFVGRPAMMTDACEGYDLRRTFPEVDSVWLDSPVGVGVRDLRGGQVAETVEVGALRVTAFSRDGRLRQRILATAEEVTVDGNGCPTHPGAMPTTDHGSLEPEFMSACLYDSQDGTTTLVWSGIRNAAQARDYVAAYDDESATYDPPRVCDSPASGQWIALGIHGTDGGTRWDVVSFECLQILSAYRTGAGEPAAPASPLAEDTARPWAGGGVRAYAWGPMRGAGGKMEEIFRGILG